MTQLFQRLEDRDIVHAICVFIFIAVSLLSWPALNVATVALIVHLPDDCFYYLQVARNILEHGFSSFDGLNFTNGYQPLWMIFCIMAQWIASGDKDGALRLTLFLQVCMTAAAMALLFRMLSLRLSLVAAAIGVAFWLAASDQLMMNGLETGVTIFMYVWAITVLWPLDGTEPITRWPLRRVFYLGVVLGLLFLARTDSILVLASIGSAWVLHILMRLRPWNKWNTAGTLLPLLNLVALASGILVVAGPYIASNIFLTDHITPVSGAAKTLHSEMVRRAAAVSSGRSELSLTLSNLLWVVRDRQWSLLVGLLGFPALYTLMIAIGRRDLVARYLTVLLPVSIGIVLQYLFYAFVFYGHSQTAWYYAPTYLMSAITMAIAVHIIGELIATDERGRAGVVLLFALATFGLGVRVLPVMYGSALIALAALLVLVGWAFPTFLGRVVGLVAPFLAVWILYRVPGIETWSWTLPILVVGAAVVALAVVRLPTRPALVAIAVALLIWPLNIVRGDFLAWRTTTDSWNSGLYNLAKWLSQNSPPNVKVASYSAGILGYFSNRTVVNIDGLANSYDFLYNVWQKNRVGQYVQQFDLTAEANPLPLQPPPGGCVVDIEPPPPILILDGRPHQVTLFQFRGDGPLPCGSAHIQTPPTNAR